MCRLISSLSYCVVFAIINPDVAHGHVAWNFGKDTVDSYVLGRFTGGIQFLQKTTQIPLNVPKCHDVTFVRVEVENRVSTPSVTYNEHALKITIAYTWLQVSYSSYDIVVKGYPIPGCNQAEDRDPVDSEEEE